MMGIQCRDGFVEVSRRRRKLGHELVGTTLVIQVHCDDLRWLDWRQVDGIRDRNGPAVAGNEALSLTGYFGGVPIQENSPCLYILRHWNSPLRSSQLLADQTRYVPVRFQLSSHTR